MQIQCNALHMSGWLASLLHASYIICMHENYYSQNMRTNLWIDTGIIDFEETAQLLIPPITLKGPHSELLLL